MLLVPARVLSNNEIRTLGTRILPWPMDPAALVNLRHKLANCTRADEELTTASGSGSAALATETVPPPRATTSISPLAAFAELVGDDTTQLEISKAVFEHCQPVLDLVRTSTKQQTKYKYEGPPGTRGPGPRCFVISHGVDEFSHGGWVCNVAGCARA